MGQLSVDEVPVPVIQPGETLVRVMATGITRTELSWEPTLTYEDGSSRLPSIPGHEVAGIVEAVTGPLGSRAVGLAAFPPGSPKNGDRVYGLTDFFRDGAAAEFIAVKSSSLALMPAALDFDKAAAIPLAGLTAWQALFDFGGLGAGHRVLIHGASGGVGTLAIQLAKWKGAYVIGTCSAENLSLVKELGADEVIDYKTQRFDELVSDVDVVLDALGGETRERSWKILKQGGILVSIAEPFAADFQPPAGLRAHYFIVTPNRSQLESMTGLIDKGLLKPIIAEVLPLDQTRQAFEITPHAPGKTVINVCS
jgi:NADPH:quinone reductase-like Zn-dependent oxidoreductase